MIVLSDIWRQLILHITFIMFTKHLQIVIRWQPYIYFCKLFIVLRGQKAIMIYNCFYGISCLKKIYIDDSSMKI